jgi:hypothetical protein
MLGACSIVFAKLPFRYDSIPANISDGSTSPKRAASMASSTPRSCAYSSGVRPLGVVCWTWTNTSRGNSPNAIVANLPGSFVARCCSTAAPYVDQVSGRVRSGSPTARRVACSGFRGLVIGSLVSSYFRQRLFAVSVHFSFLYRVFVGCHFRSLTIPYSFEKCTVEARKPLKTKRFPLLHFY